MVKQQRGDFGEITKETVEQGDTIAMLDRNCITEKFGRRVFVHLEDEVYAFIFDEDGNPIDEPSNFVTKGQQKLEGDHGFLEEWSTDDSGYYMVGMLEPQQSAPATALTGTTARGLMVVGQRVKECIKTSEADTVGTWYGATVMAVSNEPAVLAAYDDGDCDDWGLDRVQGLLEMGKLGLLEDGRGLVADEWQVEKALEMSSLKTKDGYMPVGVLMGDGKMTLCGQQIFSSHYLSLERLETVSGGSRKQRPSRGAGGIGDDKRGGLATFRRGDRVISTGPVGAEGPTTETIFGVMHFGHRKQLHRYLITYDESLEQFGVAAWTAWRRTLADPAPSGVRFDIDAREAQVEVAPNEAVAKMLAKWQESPLTSSGLDALHKQTQLGPVRNRAAQGE